MSPTALQIDQRALAALVHPLRRRLLDLLKLEGPATASMLAGRTDEAVGNVSHHLRVLAVAHLIAEAPELARDRRERWWRRTVPRLSWSSLDFAGDAAGEAIAAAAESLNLDVQVGHVRRWNERRDDEQAQWPSGPFSRDTWLRLTDAELARVAAELSSVLTRWADRELPDDGQERSTVFVFARGVPARP